MIENNKVYEILLKSVRTNGNKNDPRRIHIDEQIKNLKESIIMYGHTLYELHNPEHILYILDKIPSFVNALNAVYDSPHPHISDMGLSLAVAKISDEIKQNTKGNTNSLNKDIHSTLMDAFNLLIDAVASCKVVPRNDVSIISSIQQIQRRLNELEIDLIQGLPDINYSGMRPDSYNERPNPDSIKSLLGDLPSGTGNTQSSENEGYKPGLYKSNDIKKFVSNVNELYPVKLKYNDKTYYIDSELTNKAGTKCVRMFDTNGYLVGYIFKDARCTDLPLIKTFSSVTVVNASDADIVKALYDLLK